MTVAATCGIVACQGVRVGPSHPPATIASAIDSAARVEMQRGALPGLMVATVSGDNVAWATYGVADIGERRPFTDSTLINIASVSKPLMAWLVLQVGPRYQLTLDMRPLRSLELAGVSLDPRADSATVRQLLQHQAGVGMASVPCPPLDSARPSTEAALRGEANGGAISNLKPISFVRSPGAQWAYSGGGYTLLQLLLERRSGLSFESLAQRDLFAPMQLPFATTNPDPARVAQPYLSPTHPSRKFRCVGEAAGGIFLSVRDAAAVLRSYVARGNRAQVVALTAAPVPVLLDGVDTKGARYALGHFVWDSSEGDTLIFHSGGNPGVIAYLVVHPRRRAGLFVASNSSQARGAISNLVATWARTNGFASPPVF